MLEPPAYPTNEEREINCTFHANARLQQAPKAPATYLIVSQIQTFVRIVPGLIILLNAVVIVAQRDECMAQRCLVDNGPFVFANFNVSAHRILHIVQFLIEIAQAPQRNAFDVAHIARLVIAFQCVIVLFQFFVGFAERHQHSAVVRSQLLGNFVVIQAVEGHFQDFVGLAEAIPRTIVTMVDFWKLENKAFSNWHSAAVCEPNL